ncbi:hypothetical protein IQ241_05790 [Romeria aff. gracilis LEGE 07310]|uniref:SMODS and SLOG-associating 2TM effector domain-containing protein n=1 Tax=Vasconcelosia minhoensis LEGE 07310 TaxID=915328 RepID=A0A8J7A9Z8_9CYAN|nr:hypothetical protein [Romeria gracilis]MBE9076811.1 hypothetical protein [Romeria aff. gracilis LEGE 07310]
MNGLDNISDFIAERLHICRTKRRSYEIWLSILQPLNIVTIAAPAVLSVIAGSTILTEPAFFGPDGGRLVAGLCAFVSAVLTTIHKALNCDNHQSECRRLVQTYSALEASYERLTLISEEKQLKEEVLKLDIRLEQIKEGAGAQPPDWCRRRAQRELSKTKYSRH